MKKAPLQMLLLTSVCLLLGSIALQAKDIDRSKKKGNRLQTRTFNQNDLQRNTVSLVDFYTTNFGIFGLNISNNQGGGFWPRGSGNQYIFGGGVWFAAQKFVPVYDQNNNIIKNYRGGDSVALRKLSEISYNPNSGNSWMSPGRVEDGDQVVSGNPDTTLLYRNYFSTDMNQNGVPLASKDKFNWPIWDNRPVSDTLSFLMSNKQQSRYFGNYIRNAAARTSDSMPVQSPLTTRKGPVFVSGEDVISVYKDTDIRSFEEGGRTDGFPLRLQFEQRVYSWGYGEYANFIFLAYNIINKSQDTLLQCWMAPAYDFDLAPPTALQLGARNDRVDYYEADTTLNLAYQWTQATAVDPERGRGFGYIGMDFLESPAVDANGFIRTDKSYYQNSEQLGLRTFRNWIIENDPPTYVARYEFMAAGIRERDNGPGDKRFLMATGPFNMKPLDTARVVIGMIFAATGSGGEATGEPSDVAELVRRDKFAQSVYDNAFATPKPPDIPPITWKPFNNAVLVMWDSTSEMSDDREERGMDFLGYRLYRCRNNNLDTFNTNNIPPDPSFPQYPLGRGPYGWRQVGQWVIPKPYVYTTESLTPSNVLTAPFPDLQIIPANNKAGFASIYPRLIPSSAVSDARAWLVRLVPNTQNTFWQAFWNPITPTGPISSANRYDSLTLGLIIVRPNASNPPFPTNAASSDSVARVLMNYIGTDRAIASWIVDDQVNQPIFKTQYRRYMDSVTNGRKFLDVGDDNDDGIISTDPDITKTERLINNVDYFYRLLSFDEGDYRQGTPQKINSGVTDINIRRAYPLSNGSVRPIPAVGGTVTDQGAIGGLHNFRMLVQDQQRFAELFGGHEIELEFNRNISGTTAFPSIDTISNNLPTFLKGIYGSTMVVRDKTDGNRVIGVYDINYETVDCQFIGYPSEASVVHTPPIAITAGELTNRLRNDTLASLFVHPSNRDVLNSVASFTTDKSCNGPNRFLEGTLGFAFDFNIQQYGGIFRPFSAERVNSQANTNLTFTPPGGQSPKAITTRINQRRGQFETFNQGGGEYEIEFLPGGRETITTSFRAASGPDIVRTYSVPYLEVRVRNVRQYKYFNGSDSVVVGGNELIPHASQTLPAREPSPNDTSTIVTNFPSPTLVPIGSYNLSAYGWRNGRYNRSNVSSVDGNAARPRQAANLSTGAPVGTQGRYYLSTVVDNNGNPDTLDFTHVFLIDGCTYGIDFSGKGSRNGTVGQRLFLRPLDTATATVDFNAGDKIKLSTFGGSFGLPRDGAKVTFKVPQATIAETGGNQEVTDSDLDRILVVPNPYLVTHIGQRTTYDAKIYFTNLPRTCTINIYTINGDLIRTIRHENEDGTSQQSMNVFDLQSDFRQRVSSQSLIAVIETPNGAKTIKKFSVIVGGSRILPAR